jgi:NTE family protein
MEQPTTVALALGSGGARGYAHIGAIQVLEERGFRIVVIAGSSMGALVGGLHAAGKLPEYTEWVSGLTQLDVVRLLDVSLSAPGAIRAERVVGRVRDLLQGVRIEDLPIPYTAVATDLAARREVWFQRGPVEVAIRASIAIPGVITPVMLNGRLLADGGIMNAIPIAPTSAVHADVTLAVSLAGEHRTADVTPEVESTEPRPVDEWIDRFRRSASGLLDGDLLRSVRGRFGGPADGGTPDMVDPDALAGGPEHPDLPSDGQPFGPLPAGLSKFDVMSQSLDAMQSVLTRYRLAGYPPDVLVAVPKDACRSLDFHRAAEMIELGRELTTQALDRAGLVGPAAASSEPGQGPLNPADPPDPADPGDPAGEPDRAASDPDAEAPGIAGG